MSGTSSAANRKFVYNTAETGIAADSAAIVIDATVCEDFEQADWHQIDIDALTASSGTVLIEILPYGSLDYKTLKDSNGDSAAIDAADPYPKEVTVSVSAIRLTPQSLNGTWGYSLVGK